MNPKSQLQNILITFILILTTIPPLQSQELTPDSSTLLLLHFNNSIKGANGENPLLSQNLTFSNSGIFNLALNATHPEAQEIFPSSRININEGAIEFWFKPSWAGNDNQTHYFFHYNPYLGFGLLKDGGNNLIFYTNAVDQKGVDWKVNVYNVNHWLANKWYHLAATWRNNEIRTYVNGELVAETKAEYKLAQTPSATFSLFSESQGVQSCQCLIDELRISKNARSNAEVTSSYLKGLNLAGASTTLNILNPVTIEMYETWNIYLNRPGFWNVPRIFVTNGKDTAFVSSEALDWTVSDTNQIRVVNGVLNAKKSGIATLKGTYLGKSVSIPIVVKKAIKPPVYETKIDPFLTIPASCAHDIMPVLIISYVPTLDGINLDLKEIKDPLPIPRQTVDFAKAHILGISKHVKFTLEEGSKFRGYNNTGALPYLGYKVVDYITVHEGVPRGFPVPGQRGFFTDFNQIISRFNGKHYIEDLGVKEIWIFGIHSDEVVVVESNMSSPSTGDISNSYRWNDDQPIYNKTYITYNYNITRTGNEAVHNHGHQLEAMCSHAAFLQDGNTDLFWKEFVGWNSGKFPILRAGDTHHPPNTQKDYEYNQPVQSLSDIMDWKPEGGKGTLVNVDTWGKHAYNWPEVSLPESYYPYGWPNEESNWYLFWMQSFPGYGNKIPYGSRYMTNWWKLVADWDKNYKIGLHQSKPEEDAKCILPPAPVTFDIDDNVTDSKGAKVSVPVKVTNFTNIRSFTMTVQVDDKSIASITGLSSTLKGFDKFESEAGKTWTVRYNSSDPVTLTDGSTAFTIEVLLNGNPDQSTNLNIIGNPLSIAALKIENNVTSSVTVEVKSGSVLIKKSSIDLSGKVITRKNEGIQNAIVNVIGTLSLANVTDQNGNYSFSGLSPDKYTIKVEKSTNAKNGVDIFDLTALEDHIITRKPITDPYRYLAADVNNDGVIDILDISDVEDVIIKRKDNYKDNLSWRFIPTNESLSLDKVKNKSYATTRVTNNTGNQAGLDFYGIKTGDIDDSADPKNISSGAEDNMAHLESRSAGSLSIKIPEIKARKNESIYLPVILENFKDVRAFQFQVKWNINALSFVAVTDAIKQLDGFGQSSYQYNPAEPGVLNVLWKSTNNQSLAGNVVLLKLNLKVLANLGESPIIAFEEVKALSLEGAINDAKVTSGRVTVSDVSTRIDFSEVDRTSITVYPNPAQNRVRITGSNVFEVIGIADMNGRQFLLNEKGRDSYEIDLSRFNSGVYFLQLVKQGRLYSKKIFVEKFVSN